MRAKISPLAGFPAAVRENRHGENHSGLHGQGGSYHRRGIGIGRATAMAFHEQGAKLVIGDVSDGARETADQIKAAGGDALFVKTNVSDAASVEALMTAAIDHHDRCRIQ